MSRTRRIAVKKAQAVISMIIGDIESTSGEPIHSRPRIGGSGLRPEFEGRATVWGGRNYIAELKKMRDAWPTVVRRARMTRPGPSKLKLHAKRWLYPGLDLHTRCRFKHLPSLYLSGPGETLDAGCGNGAMALAAIRMGHRVTGISYLEREVRDTRAL